MKIKKIFIISAATFAFSLSAQVRNNATPSNGSATGTTAFLDASSSTTWNGTNNQGKGLVFPRTDLTAMTALVAPVTGIPSGFPTRLDGMVVYNTATGTAATGTANIAVTPGFYFYDNKSTTLNGGTWRPFSPTAANGGGKDFWTLTGNTGTTTAPVTETQGTAGDPSTYTYSKGAGNFMGTTDAQNIVLASNNVPRLEIGSKTAQSVGGKNFDFVLDVLGKARFRDGIVTSASTYPDYVFDNYFTGKSKENPTYKFRSLAETEQYIKENKHLPGVTKIDALSKENGAYLIDNTQLSIQSLEKVEELYLHTIAQQKEIEALKAEIAEIKASLKK